MTVHVCTETFTGETPTGPVTFFEGISTLDASKKADAALLKLWGKYFTEKTESTKDLKAEASK